MHAKMLSTLGKASERCDELLVLLQRYESSQGCELYSGSGFRVTVTGTVIIFHHKHGPNSSAAVASLDRHVFSEERTMLAQPSTDSLQ